MHPGIQKNTKEVKELLSCKFSRSRGIQPMRDFAFASLVCRARWNRQDGVRESAGPPARQVRLGFQLRRELRLPGEICGPTRGRAFVIIVSCLVLHQAMGRIFVAGRLY